MQTQGAIAQYQEKEMDRFWWYFIMLTLTVGRLTGIAFVAGPVVAIIYFGANIWTGLFLVLTPFGLWITFKFYNVKRDFIWINTHRNTYTFYPETIHVDTWEPNHPNRPLQKQIALKSIQKIYLAPYVWNTNYNYRRKSYNQTSFILYILHSCKDTTELLKVRFALNYENIAIWLNYLKEKNIPVQFTPKILYVFRMHIYTDAEIIDILNNNPPTVPVHYEGDLEQMSSDIFDEWYQAHGENDA